MNISRKLFLLLGVTLLGTFSACTWWQRDQKDEEAVHFILVNVLDKKYYDDCHMVSPGVLSVNVPMEELQAYALDARNKWHKEKTTIVLYCGNYKCLASGESATLLKELGFKNVWAYEGGTAEWRHLGYPVEGACTSGYLNDYQRAEGYTPTEIAITIEQLQEKIKEFISR